MKPVSLVFVILAVLSAGGLMIARVLEWINLEEFKDVGAKIGLVLVVLYVVVIIVIFLTRRSQTEKLN